MHTEEGRSYPCPDEENTYESESNDVKEFKALLRRKSENAARVIEICKSGLRLPPSNNEVTLQLTEDLSKTEDLALFESKVIQIYIHKRWAHSRWLFIF